MEEGLEAYAYKYRNIGFEMMTLSYVAMSSNASVSREGYPEQTAAD